jgi:hypothetical protein
MWWAQFAFWRALSNLWFLVAMATKMASSKLNAKTIVDLVEAHDVAKNKRYKKGKFLGKVRC